MKKLIIMAMLVATGIAAHAATVNWVLAGVQQPNTTTAASGYAAYLFATTVAKDDVVAAIGAGTFGTTYASQAVASGETNASGVLSKQFGNYSGTTESPTVVSFYAVVFDTGASSLASAENYAISGTDVDVTFTSSTGMKSALFSNFTANNSWQAIPEPTSGLLLLVGGALLALKRKRA